MLLFGFVGTSLTQKLCTSLALRSFFRDPRSNTVNRSRSYRHCSRAFSSTLTEGSNPDPATDQYENALCELESEKLYGSTPKLYDLDQLANMAKKGRLNLAPKYQRGYVWKSDRASRLVVTALCNRIVPGIVMHEKEKGLYDVVDGKQRLTTLLSFYLAGDDPELYEQICAQQSAAQTFVKLEKLDENYESLEGLTYNMLSGDRKRALQSFPVACTIIPYGTPKEEVFSVYEDINSGGEDLKAQQLRRAVYYGDYIFLLDQLALNEDFQSIRDPKSFHKGQYQLCPRESDRELILRAFAWRRSHSSYKRPLKKFLNDELQHYEDLKQVNEAKAQAEIENLKEEFCWVMKVWRNVHSESDAAFRTWTQKANGKWGWSPSINVGLWDVIYVVLCKLREKFPTEPIYAQRKGKLVNAIKSLFESEELEISGGVTAFKFEERCIAVRKALLGVLESEDGSTNRTRKFPQSDALKQSLFQKQGGRCTICSQTIDSRRLSDGSYVQLDHIEPYSRGGSTTSDNAALTHAACNQSKGARAA